MNNQDDKPPLKPYRIKATVLIHCNILVCVRADGSDDAVSKAKTILANHPHLEIFIDESQQENTVLSEFKLVEVKEMHT